MSCFCFIVHCSNTKYNVHVNIIQNIMYMQLSSLHRTQVRLNTVLCDDYLYKLQSSQQQDWLPSGCELCAISNTNVTTRRYVCILFVCNVWNEIEENCYKLPGSHRKSKRPISSYTTECRRGNTQHQCHRSSCKSRD